MQPNDSKLETPQHRESSINFSRLSMIEMSSQIQLSGIDSGEKSSKTKKKQKKKKDKQKYERQEKDFYRADQDGRNQLHRAALEQDKKLIADVVSEYVAVIDFIDIAVKVKEFVRKTDNFKTPAILMCCFLNNDEFVNNNMRFECIQYLVEKGADVNSLNPRTRWSPLFWTSFYGDRKSTEFLINNGAITFLPDSKAGQQGHKEVFLLYIQHMPQLLYEYQLLKQDKLRIKNQNKFIMYQDYLNSYDKQEFLRYLSNPILLNKLLYWTCKFNLEIKYIIQICQFPRVYYHAPISSEDNMTPLHAIAAFKEAPKPKQSVSSKNKQNNVFQFPNQDKEGATPMANQKKSPKPISPPKEQQSNIKILDYLIEQELDKKEKGKLEKIAKFGEFMNFRQRLRNNVVFNFNSEDLKLYSERYQKEVKEFANFEKRYYQRIKKFIEQAKKEAEEQIKKEKELELRLKQEEEERQKKEEEEEKKLLEEKEKQEKEMKKKKFKGKTLNLVTENKYKQKNQDFEDPKDVKIDLQINIDQKPISQKTITETDENETKMKQYEILDLDQKDNYGNTALHVASIIGNENLIQVLLNYGSDMEKENKEFFKARELTQNPQVLQLYQEELKKQGSRKAQSSLNMSVLNIIEAILKQRFKDNKNKVIQEDYEPYEQIPLEEKKVLVRMYEYSTKLFVPDFVLKCNMDSGDNEDTDNFFLSDLENDNPSRQRLNFQISMLQNAGFEIYIMKSYFEKGCYYLMLKHKEEKLEQQAQEMQLQVKLMDSYDLEPFSQIKQDIFEPFRSRQRQEIIESHVKRIMNLDQLIQQKVISQYYCMHTYGGMEKIKYQWIDKPKVYWPQPLNQIDDYLIEGQNQNFTSLTTMRLYLGEKISFFFAWKSYLTCALIVIAVPGLALQIYIILTNNYETSLLPYWVFFVCIWSTLQVEFWKRKASEISTRWGCIDLMVDEEAEQKALKEGFSGDEEIDDVTGKVTKFQKTEETLFLFLLSVPILSIFVAASIATFIGVEYLIANYAMNNLFIKLFLGIIQGVGITILNIMYTWIAQWFVIKENHKYEGAYESSLIYKNVLFKFINSYLVIFYAIFNTNKNLEEIFQVLLPVLIVKQVNYMILEVFFPQMLYLRKEKQYFEKIRSSIIQQQKLREELVDYSQYRFYFDPVESFWKSKKPEHRLSSSSRAVLKILEESKIKENLIQGNRYGLEQNLDVDAVELNSLKLDFEGTMNLFMEGLIDYGYITLFAAAFPIGPCIAMVVSIFEIKMKIFTFLYVYKRPKCARCAGIGEWLNILEMMSIFSVFSNFALLYFKHKSSTVEIYQSDTLVKTNHDWEVGFFLISVAVLLILKQFFKDIIPDKPEWVMQEIEKMKHKQEQESGKNVIQLVKDLEGKRDEFKMKYRNYKLNLRKKKQQLTDSLNIKKMDIEELQKDLEKLKESHTHRYTPAQMISTIGKSKKFANEYDMIFLGVMRQKYIITELALLYYRLGQFQLICSSLIFICQDCGEKQASVDCINCIENFCMLCFKKFHQMMNLKHQVRLLNDISNYNGFDLMNLEIIKGQNEIEKQKYKFTKKEKEQLEKAQMKKIWKKFEYFALPTYRRSELYYEMERVYEHFYEEYIKNTGLAYRNYEIDLKKIFKVDFIRKPIKQHTQLKKMTLISESSQKKLRTVIIQENPEKEITPLHEILNSTSFNTEDKLFMNRIAFLTFKRLRHLSNFEKFYSYCVIAQEGMFEQRILLLMEFMDQSDDDQISKFEMERIFMPSLIQEMNMNKKVNEMINELFPKGKDNLSKKELTKLLLNISNEEYLKSFLEALVQEKEK